MEIERAFEESKGKSARAITALIVMLIFFALISVYAGAVKFGFFEIFDPANKEIRNIRLARLLMAVIAGGGLSVTGAILQGLLRNPLCEPYVLGISSGAALGAVSAISVGIGYTVFGFGILPVFAFLGAAITLFFIYRIAQINGRLPLQNLLLSGVVIGAVLSSVVIFIDSFSQSQTLHSVMWWMLGSLQVFDLNLLFSVGSVVAIGVILSFMFHRELNAISLGEEEALHLGIDIERVKKTLFFISALITGAIVSAAGMIGFVGLIVPHFMRLIVGPNYKVLIPASFLAGAIFLIVCDSLARVAISPSEIPIGVITAIVGGPFFIYLLRKKSKV
ncbi:MAG: iron ABC transporter permease [Candidatus Omnitrophota bacterium]|nr:iron ABC transporter permease [Candidatus Omnitrophota bacterium]